MTNGTGGNDRYCSILFGKIVLGCLRLVMISPRSLRNSKFSLTKGSKKGAYVRLRQNRGWAFFLTAITSLILFFMVSGSVLALIAFALFSKNLPSPDKLTNRKVIVSTRIYDRNDKLLYDIYRDVNRSLVKLDEIPKSVIDATLATEDADFYVHRGFDVLAIFRAIRNVILYRDLQGGSTITQQLVKNTLLSRERSVVRKIKELVLSIQIERIYNKDQILQIYFNEVPYGGTAWGIAAASELYFGKKVSELTLAEAALLAGLPQSPSTYSPFGRNPEKARERQRYVLYLMESRGWTEKDGHRSYLATDEGEKAKKTPLEYIKPGQGIKAPHFSLYVRGLLEEKYGAELVESGGLQVKTSLDLDLQEKFQKIVYEEVEKVRALRVGNGALVAVDPRSGEVLAMVGSKDYFDEKNDGNFNVAVNGLRQPGSSIKPITYAVAFQRGLTASTMIMDVPTQFPGSADDPIYSPVNYDGSFRGPISLRKALGNSINIPAVKILKIVGVPSVVDTAKSLGITTLKDPKRYGLSLTLGGGEVPLIEMVGAFSAFADGGTKVTPVSILEVRDKNGKILEEFHKEEGPRVFTKEVAYLISNILSDNGARSAVFGANSLLNIPNFNVAVKTGTSNDKRDNWTIGYTPSVVIGVWVGNNDNTPMDPKLASGITGASPVWNRAMKEYLKGKKNEAFERPDKIIEMDVDKLTGMLPYEGQETVHEIFVSGTEPKTTSDIYQKIKICRVDKKIANQTCQDRGDYDEKTFILLHDPAAISEFQPDVTKFLNETDGFKDSEQYHPPTETSTL